MIYLFSNQPGALLDGATFMRTRSLALHPATAAFYLTAQQGPMHGLTTDLKPNSTFADGSCRLANGEAAIIVGHGAADNKLYNEAGQDVTDAAVRLLTAIAKDNPGGGYQIFLAACGGAVRQPGSETTLLISLVKGAPHLAEQLREAKISCWGYTASSGLVLLETGVPANRAGTHIYGTLTDPHGIVQHCGYDTRITTRLSRTSAGQYVTIFFSPALYTLQSVVDWVGGGYRPDMQTKFPELFATLLPTS